MIDSFPEHYDFYFTYMRWRSLEESEEEFPGQKISQNEAVLHTEGLHHCKLTHLHTT